MHPQALRHPSDHRTWAEIDLGAVAQNVRSIAACVGADTMVMPLVKADAYGHGAVNIARAAIPAGAKRLGVATVAEGEELRAAGVTVPIQVIGTCLPEEIGRALEADLILSLHEAYIASLVAIAARELGKTAVVHMKIDTGMGRLGILPEEAAHTALFIQELPNIELEGVFMHFAEATDEIYSHQQMERFNRACAELEHAGISGLLRHAASTVPAILYPQSRYEAVRPGIGLYGIACPAWLHGRLELKPVLSWRAVIIQTKDYPHGSNLGYNRTFTTRRPTRAAILPVGYADGYWRQWSNTASVLVRGQRCPVIGMVSMDYTMVDVTDVPDVNVGTIATLIGADGSERITVEELSALVPGQIPYEVPVRIGARVPRIPVNG